MSEIRVGTCGYGYYDSGNNWKAKYTSKLAAYSHQLDVLELNRTFYDLPQVSTAERWRREVADDFTFTLKAWQALTHPWSSPTWNNHRDAIPEKWTEKLGYLRPTTAVREAWTDTLEIAEAINA